MAAKQRTKATKGRKKKGGNSNKGQNHSNAKKSSGGNANDNRNGNYSSVMDRSPTPASASIADGSNKNITEETQENTLLVDTRSNLEKIHSEDDLDGLEVYLSTYGCYDSATLAEYMPRTSQDLYDGNISTEDVVEELMYLRNTARWKNCDNTELFDQELLDHEDYRNAVCDSLANQLVFTALPERFMKFGRPHAHDTHAQHEAFEGLRESFFQAVAGALRKLELEELSLGHYVDKCKLALESICETWAPRFDQALFYSKSGTFLRLCPVYKKNNNATKEMVSELLQNIMLFFKKGKQDSAVKHLIRAVDSMSRGVHLMNDSENCWTCGVACKSLTPCKHCNVARYCGYDCRMYAWNDGHAGACCDLPYKYQILQESLKMVEEAHKTGKLGDHFRLSPNLDYTTIQHILLRIPCLGQKNEFSNFSMHCYYESLAKVARGDWWLFREPTILGDATELEERCLRVLVLLANEELSECHRTIPDDTPMALSAEDFLNFYKESSPYWAREQDRISMVRQEKLECLEFFRNYHHRYQLVTTVLDERDHDDMAMDGDEEIDENTIDGLKGLTISGLENEGSHVKENPVMILAEVSANAVAEPKLNNIVD